MPEIVALLPMKGHSERIVGKNLRPLAGRPLYHWIMSTLIATPAVDEIVVDTDGDEIADDVSTHFPGVTVRRRPPDLLGDMIPMHDIVARFVADHPSLDIVLQTHATNPLLTSATLTSAIRAFLDDDEHDSLMSVTELKARLFDPSARPMNHDPSILLRTQDLEPVFEENSNIYIAPRALVESTGRRVGSNPILFPVERFESLDIDEEIEFRMVECLMQGQSDV